MDYLTGASHVADWVLHDSQFLAVVSPGSYKKAKDSARHPQRRLPAVSECLGTCCHANCWSAAACGGIESPRPQRSRWWMKERLWIHESTSLTRSIRYFTALDISIHGIMPIVHYHRLYCLSKIVLSSNWHLEAIWGNAYDLHLAYKLNTLIQITHHSSFQPIQTSVDAPDTITDLPGRGTLRWKAWWFLRKSVMALELSGRTFTGVKDSYLLIC